MHEPRPVLSDRLEVDDDESTNTRWVRRFLLTLTVLGWIAIAGVFVVVLGRFSGALITFGISMLIAYVIYPLVRWLEHMLPRPLAILVVYLGILALLILLVYFVVLTAIGELATLLANAQNGLPGVLQQVQKFLSKLPALNISPNSLLASGQQILNELLAVVGNVLPLVNSLFLILINTIIIISLSVYFLLDGPRAVRWCRQHTPLRWRGKVNFFFDTLHQTMGGFVRGQITLATVISVVMGVGYAIIGVPYVMLLAIVIFVFEFIPQIGSYISITIAVVLTLVTRGWQVALIALVFSSIVQGGLDGQVLAPRILGHAVGIHPIISIAALLIGADLFGLLGALLAAPIAGIVQIFVVTYWRAWIRTHPEQFPELSTGPIDDTGETQDMRVHRHAPGLDAL